MSTVHRRAHITRPVRPVPQRQLDVDNEPLSEAERNALAGNDGPYVTWDALKAELSL